MAQDLGCRSLPEGEGTAAGPSRLGNTGFAQTFGHTGDDLRSDAPRYIAHDGTDRRLRMELVEAAQTLLRFLEPTQMAAEAQLEAQRRQPTVFAQCSVGERQSRLVAAGGQMCEGLRLNREKSMGRAALTALPLARRGLPHRAG